MLLQSSITNIQANQNYINSSYNINNIFDNNSGGNNSADVSISKSSEKDKPLIDGAIKQLDKELAKDDTSIQYSIHDKTKELIVKIVDNQTKEVIKEIPSEKILDMVDAMCERAGIFINTKK